MMIMNASGQESNQPNAGGANDPLVNTLWEVVIGSGLFFYFAENAVYRTYMGVQISGSGKYTYGTGVSLFSDSGDMIGSFEIQNSKLVINGMELIKKSGDEFIKNTTWEDSVGEFAIEFNADTYKVIYDGDITGEGKYTIFTGIILTNDNNPSIWIKLVGNILVIDMGDEVAHLKKLPGNLEENLLAGKYNLTWGDSYAESITLNRNGTCDIETQFALFNVDYRIRANNVILNIQGINIIFTIKGNTLICETYGYAGTYEKEINY
jgi:hypothetical protein